MEDFQFDEIVFRVGDLERWTGEIEASSSSICSMPTSNYAQISVRVEMAFGGLTVVEIGPEFVFCVVWVTCVWPVVFEWMEGVRGIFDYVTYRCCLLG